jgi:predicted dehydrogenase
VFSTLPESRFVAVFDTSPDRAAAFSARYGVRPYSDIDALLADRDVQMASICTPHPTHPDLAVACAQAGVHALVEKPMAVDLKGCDRAISAAEQAGITLGVVSQRRFYEPVQRVKQAIESDPGHPGRYGLARCRLLPARPVAWQVGD